jgi:hypothetical protein
MELTASTVLGEREQCLRSGMDGYLIQAGAARGAGRRAGALDTAAADTPAIREQAHCINGCALNLALPQLADRCAELEAARSEQAPSTTAIEALRQLLQELVIA